jgi:hypothetical protein
VGIAGQYLPYKYFYFIYDYLLNGFTKHHLQPATWRWVTLEKLLRNLDIAIAIPKTTVN